MAAAAAQISSIVSSSSKGSASSSFSQQSSRLTTTTCISYSSSSKLNANLSIKYVFGFISLLLELMFFVYPLVNQLWVKTHLVSASSYNKFKAPYQTLLSSIHVLYHLWIKRNAKHSYKCAYSQDADTCHNWRFDWKKTIKYCCVWSRLGWIFVSYYCCFCNPFNCSNLQLKLLFP